MTRAATSMEKVLVIGPGGAGKSTFASRLGQITDLPVIHLDTHYWHPGWVATPKEEWAEVVSSLLEQPRWIMDGNYGGTLDVRFEGADTIVFLDLPRTTCLWGVIKRRLTHRGAVRFAMADGCPERLTLQFLVWIWQYPHRRRPGILERLDAVGHEKKVVLLRSRAEMERFIEEMERR